MSRSACSEGTLRDPPFDLVGYGLAGPTRMFSVRPKAAYVAHWTE